MTKQEIGALLAFVGRIDPRLVRTALNEVRDQLAQWHELLAEVPLVASHDWDARAVAREHALCSPYPIIPGDIARQWRTYRHNRLERHTDPLPAADPDNPAAWAAELRANRHAVASGTAAPATHRQLTPRPKPELDAPARGSGGIPPDVRTELARYRPVRAAHERARAAGQPDALEVTCPWCEAPREEPCRSHRAARVGSASRTTPHPGRLKLAAQQARPPAA